MELFSPNRPGRSRITTGLEHFVSAWPELLQNPLWYVVIIASLAGLTFQFQSLWWLTMVIAVSWGLWLLWLFFSQDEADNSYEESLAGYLVQAQLYQAKISQLLQTSAKENDRTPRQQLADRVERWTVAIQTLVERISGLRQNRVLQNDLATVPQAIEALTTQLIVQTDPALCFQLQRALLNRQKQLEALEVLHNTMSQAEIQLENTISLLGTIYSQLLTGQSTRHVADYGRFLVHADEEVQRLQDQLEALQEVKGEYWRKR